MANLKEMVEKSTAAYPYTAVMRNYLASSTVYAAKYTEWQKAPGIYAYVVNLYKRDTWGRAAEHLFRIEHVGDKYRTLEFCFARTYDYVVSQWKTQGLDDDLQVEVIEQPQVDDKKENVIISGNEGLVAGGNDPIVNPSLGWSNTEKYYNFTDSNSGLMARWFPLESIPITASYGPDNNGGFVKTWIIPESLITNDFDSINILPIRGFLKGEYELEFKMVAQANSFQQCLLMLSLAPYSYGIVPKLNKVSGIKIDGVQSSSPLRPWAGISNWSMSYNDFQCAVQRPNVILDVSSGGEVMLKLTQKYHKTLIRNFDYAQVATVNPGIRGSNMGSVSLHVLSPLLYGTGSTSFNVRIFYRFVKANLTAMVPVVNKLSGVLYNPDLGIKLEKAPRAFEQLKSVLSEKDLKVKSVEMKKFKDTYKTQGPALSMLTGIKTVVDTTSDVIGIVERAGQSRKKGIGAKNRDKPNDIVSQVRVVPRPRTNFSSGVGIDDSIVMGVAWDELTEFFVSFTDEPTSFYEYSRIVGFLQQFDWSTAQLPGDSLFTWNVHPTLLPGSQGNSDLNSNVIRNPMMISSCAFTNYWGTIELMFQFVKTNSHRGAIEVAIYFGGSTAGTGLKSTYVKILNIQENPIFKVTIPYIYDTSVRTLTGTATPLYVPNITTPTTYSFFHTATVKVRVLNELSAVSVVSQKINCIVWVRGGTDFGLNFPHAMNTTAVPLNFREDMAVNPINVRETYQSNSDHRQYFWDVINGNISNPNDGRYFYVTQGDDEEDFNQGSFVNNRITNTNHMDFKTLLKMPVKILNSFKYEPTATFEYTTIRNVRVGDYTTRQYFCLPVCPLNMSLVNFLNEEYFNSIAKGTLVGNSIIGNYESWKSIQGQILMMFMLFRGTLTYTVVIKNGTKPVYYSYIPHDYQLRKLMGTLPIKNMISYELGGDGNNRGLMGTGILGMMDDSAIDLAFTGLINGFIIPSVNPTEKISIPMSTQNNFILLNRQQASAVRPKVSDHTLKTMRENSEWFNGTFTLWSDEKFEFDIYLNCGDDMELGGFMGHPGVQNLYSQFAMSDNWRVQGLDVDFKCKELTQFGWNSLKKTASSFGFGLLMGTMTTAFNPTIASITGALAVYSTIGGITQLKELCSEVPKRISVETESIVSELTSVGTDALMNIIEEFFPFLRNSLRSVGTTIWAVSQQLIHAILANNWKNTAFASFCVLMELKLVTMSDWEHVRDKMERCALAIMPNIFSCQGLEKDTVDSAWMPLMEVLVSIIGVRFQMQSIGGLRTYLRDIFKYQNYKNVSGMNAILMFTRTLFRATSLIVKTCFAVKDPNIALLEKIQAKDKLMGEFVVEANRFLNVFVESDFKKKNKRVEFLHTILRAYKLRILLVKIGNPRLTSQLLTLCDKVIDKASKSRYLLRCDIVTQEPFIICIEGVSNIGKSFSVYDMVGELLQSTDVKYTNPDLIFTIPAGTDYWNGYMDQPVLWYDDWCNVADEQTMRQHIAQLYALKTSAPFNVPRAELENKEQIATPQMVIMTTNLPFPTSNVMSYPVAVYRRRDILVKFSLADGKTISDFNDSQLANFDHIEVQFYNKVEDPASLQTTKMTYQNFLQEAKARFQAFRTKEAKNQKTKYESLLKAVERSPLDDLDFENPFVSIEKFVYEQAEGVTDAILEANIEELLFQIKNQVVLEENSPRDEDLFRAQGLIGEIGKIYVSGKEKVTEKFDEWMLAYNRKAMRCSTCGCFAAVHGTTFWCNDHSHYICLHCACAAGLKQLRQDVHEFDDTTSWSANCPKGQEELKNCDVIVINKGFYYALSAQMIGDALETPYQFYTALKTLFCKNGAPFKIKTVYALVMFFKIFITSYTSIVKGQYQAFLTNWSQKRFTKMNYFTEGLGDSQIIIKPSVLVKLRDYMKLQVYKDKLINNEEDQWVCLDGCGSDKCQDSVLYSVAQTFVSGCELLSGTDEITLQNAKRVFTRVDCVEMDSVLFPELTTKWYTQENSVEARDLHRLYDELIEAAPRPELVPTYCCQHSLLYFGFSFSQEQYYLTSVLTEGLQIKDQICKAPNKCCLLNRRYLECLRTVFIYDRETIQTLIRTLNSNDLLYWVPKFMHYSWKDQVERQKTSLMEVLRRDWWDVYISPLGDWFMKLVRTLGPLMIAGGVLWGTWHMASKAWSVLSRLFGIGEVQGLINSGASPSRRAKTRGKTRNPYQAQALRDDENFENKLDKIASNYAIVSCGKTFISVWGLRGSTFLVPKHLGVKMAGHEKIFLKRVIGANPTLELLVSNLEFKPSQINDLMMVTCLRTAPLFKDCSHFLRKRTQEQEFTEGIFMSCHPVTSNLEDVDVKIFSTISNFEASESSTGSVYSTSEAVTYDFQKKGLCGSLVCVHSVTPIYAMHIAGSDTLDRGVGVLLYQDSFDMSYASQGLSVAEIQDNGEDTCNYGEEVKIEYVSAIDKDLVPYIPKETNIIPSMISQFFPYEASTRPAILHKNDPSYKWEKSPLFYGVCKNGCPTTDFPIGMLELAYDVLKDRLLVGQVLRKPSILSVKEAIVGIPDIVVDDRFNDEEDVYYDSIPLDTSAGYPFSTTKIRNQYGINSTSKEPWLRVKRNDNLRVVDCEPHEFLMEVIETNTKMRRQRMLAPNIFQDCLKDERRKIDKALSRGGTRLFSMSNLEGTISLRRYTLDLTSHLRYNRIKNGMAVGINCDSMEWTILAQALLGISNNIFTTDFTNFGAGLNIGVASLFADLVKEFFERNQTVLSQEDKNEIDCLIWELLYSRHVVGNLIYGTYSGSPSGAAITVEMNSFVHLMYMYLVFRIIGLVLVGIGAAGVDTQYGELFEYLSQFPTRRLDFSYEAFLNNVYACTYGDDGIFAVSDEYKEIFNAVTINLVLKVHGIGVTDASKSKKIKKYGTLKEATFLKRSFKQVEDMPSMIYLAAIEWASVEECVRWIHKKPLAPSLATRENCISSLHLAFGHGKKKYDQWKANINHFLQKAKLEKIYIEWEDIAIKFFPEIYIKDV